MDGIELTEILLALLPSMPSSVNFLDQYVERAAPELTMSHRAKGLWSSTNNFYFLS